MAVILLMIVTLGIWAIGPKANDGDKKQSKIEKNRLNRQYDKEVEDELVAMHLEPETSLDQSDIAAILPESNSSLLQVIPNDEDESVGTTNQSKLKNL